MDDSTLARTAAALRKLKGVIKERNEQLEEFKAKKNKLEELLLGQLSDEVPQKRTESGTLAISETEVYNVDDPKALRRYAIEKRDLSMFKSGILSDYVREYMEANQGDLPPGVSSFTKRSLSFTAPRKSAPSRDAA